MNAYQERQTSGIHWRELAPPFLYQPFQEGPFGEHLEQPPAGFEVLERQMAEFVAEHRETLDDVRRHYVLPADSSVRDFLATHRAISQILLGAVPHLKACFGDDSTFDLRAPLDESGSRTLYAVVTWPGPSEEARLALARFDERWWMERAGLTGGYLTFTYELT
jgi:hypothetical protein